MPKWLESLISNSIGPLLTGATAIVIWAFTRHTKDRAQQLGSADTRDKQAWSSMNEHYNKLEEDRDYWRTRCDDLQTKAEKLREENSTLRIELAEAKGHK